MNIHQNLEVDFLGKCNTFSILRIAEKVKRKMKKDYWSISVQDFMREVDITYSDLKDLPKLQIKKKAKESDMRNGEKKCQKNHL